MCRVDEPLSIQVTIARALMRDMYDVTNPKLQPLRENILELIYGMEYLLISINNGVLAVKHGNVISAISNSQAKLEEQAAQTKVIPEGRSAIEMANSGARGQYVHQSGGWMVFCSAESIALILGGLGESVTLELPEQEI
uniref:Uncharacterized protein n=1 Tax=Ditylenchus dipsaci TaxID=166011 RepID=A0A915EUS7_9BILA